MRTHPLRRRGQLEPLPSDFARLFDPRNWPMNLFEEEPMVADWRPAVDLDEEDNEYTIRADLPGVDVKDIDVSLEDGVLTLRGERREEHKKSENGRHRVERFTGSFFRRMTLPEAADSDQVSAHFDQGVLSIRIPKSEKKQARKIKVQA